MTAQASEAPAGEDRATDGPERVGLLFVHGIGEQKRWEHLRSSVVEFAELLRSHCSDRASVSVVDRTEGWEAKPGEPRLASIAPITVSLRDQAPGGCAIDFECHEVWWADLGIRAGLWDSIRFWVWGLGQWAAPVYIDLDASRLPKRKPEDADQHRQSGLATEQPARPVVQMPRSVATELGYQMAARFNLAWAGIVAVFTVLSLSLFKRVVGFLGNVDTSPTLLVQYIGDVQVYQQRAYPGKGLVSDPGHPKRVGIRRRMVAEMVAMGARDYDRWYILAHSLGTVVAFNGLGEIGHTLPNYLQQDLWESLPRKLKRDPRCALRHDIENMMPARPAWLDKKACIDRPALFAGLRGFVTYGSPLDKFAALWPRIVAFERYGGTSPNDTKVFPQCEWINIVSKTDPVAGPVDRYGPAAEECGGKDLPHLHNLVRPDSHLVGLSHIQYWRVRERCVEGRHHDYYDAFFKWFTNPPPVPQVDQQASPEVRKTGAAAKMKARFWEQYAPNWTDLASLFVQALVLTAVVWAATTAIVGTVLAQLAPEDWRILGKVEVENAELADYAWFFLRLLPAVAAAASVVIYIAGHARWIRESWFNGRLGAHDRDMQAKRAQERDAGSGEAGEVAERAAAEYKRLRRFVWFVAAQIAAGALSFILGIVTVGYFWPGEFPSKSELFLVGLRYAAIMFGLIVFSAFVQSAIYWLLGRPPETAPPAPCE